LASLIQNADVLVVSMKSPEVLAALQEHTRADQVVLDIAMLPDRNSMRAQYQGLCW
jgi:hypothetical protein